jgi:hypothetical protein
MACSRTAFIPLTEREKQYSERERGKEKRRKGTDKEMRKERRENKWIS